MPHFNIEVIKKYPEEIINADNDVVKETKFAVVKVGGTQYKVVEGDQILVIKLDAPVGEKIILDKVLLVGSPTFTAIGTPIVPEAKVWATVEEQTLSDKVTVFKKKKRKNYRRNRGVRHPITILRIDHIQLTKNPFISST